MLDGDLQCPALVLNADFRPLSYFPLSVWCWQNAVKAVFLDRVSVLSEYEVAVRSPSQMIRLPKWGFPGDDLHPQMVCIL